jgi:hypothetical protein
VVSPAAARQAAWRERKRAAGYTFVNGRAVYRPVRRWVPGPRPHGTEGRYKQGCRCDQCRAANAAVSREKRRRAKVVKP